MYLPHKSIFLFVIFLFCTSALAAQLPSLYVDLEHQNPDCDDPGSGEISVTLEENGTTSPYTYLWSKNGEILEETGKTISNLSAGWYIVTVTDKFGCSAGGSVILFGPGLTAKILGPDQIFVPESGCNETEKKDITLTAMATGGSGNYTYNWGDGPSANPEKEITEGGYKRVIIKDIEIDGCEDRKGVTIEEIEVTCAVDPNEIHGPEGYGDKQWISVNDQLPYTVLFENDPELATAAALRVQVDVPLDEHLNPQSLRLGSFGFANLEFTVPENQVFYSQQLNVTDSLGIFVQVTAGIDLPNNKAFWILESIDPTTGLNPTSPDLGLLPVNDTITRRGEGFISFTIQPNSTSLTRDSIIAFANIIFDENEAILTNSHVNTIDAFAPTSNMNPIIADSTDTEILLSWDGNDDTDGVGLNHYALYASRNGLPYQLFQDNILDNSIFFPVAPASEYAFYTIATDYVGNKEATKTTGEVFFTSAKVPRISLLSPNGESYCLGDTISISWNPFLVESVDLLFSEDGEIFTPITTQIDSAINNYAWAIPNNIICASCKFKLVASQEVTEISSNTFSIHPLPTVSAGADTAVCNGQGITLQASGAQNYRWSPNSSLSNLNSINPTATPIENTTYFLQATDQNGCSNTDEITVIVNTLPTVSIPAFDTVFCANETLIPLTGIPSGGNFFGYTVTDNNFYPLTAGAGTYLLSYIFEDTNSCRNNATQTVTVQDTVEINFTELDDLYLEQDDPVSLVGTPDGGTFSGPGINENIFDPALAFVGNHYITYAYVDENSCPASASQQVTVYNNTSVFFTGLETQYCENESTIDLTGNPIGGIFSGPGISNNNNFSPALAGAGSHDIIYTFNAESFIQTVTVLPATNLTIVGVQDTMCLSDTPVIINGNPAGGTLSGPGVSGNYFDLPIAGPGTHLITYTYENSNRCASTENREVTVFDLPVVSFNGLENNYADTSAVVVMTGMPIGGTFSGPGVTDSIFDPSIVSNGSHLITYTYTNQIGCTNSFSQQVEINAFNSVFLTGLANTYCENDPAVTLNGNPVGGTFTGPGINDNTFNPISAGPGQHAITYTVLLPDGTTSTAIASTSVNPIPQITINNLENAYCITNSPVQLIATPFGGAWSGTGVDAFFFNPEEAGIGTHLLTYTYLDNETGCSASAQQAITIGNTVTASIENLASVYCVESEETLLTLSPQGGTLTGNGIVNQTFYPILAGEGEHIITYIYEDEGGCSDSYTETVLITATVADLSINGLEPSICENGPAIVLTGNPSGGTFSGTGITGNIFNPTEVGNVDITYSIDLGECNGTYTQTIEVLPAPVLSIGNIPGNPSCIGDSIMVEVIGGINYLWSTGDTLSSIFITNGESYGVTITDTNGCTDSDNEISVPFFEAEIPIISLDQDTLYSTEGLSYQWYLDGVLITNATEDFFVPIVDGDYSVITLDDNGCSNISEPFTFIITTVQNLELYNVNIHPNPVKDYLEVSFATNTTLHQVALEIMDVKGRQIFQQKYGDVNGSFLEKLEVSNLPSGAYLIRILAFEGNFTEKIIKIK